MNRWLIGFLLVALSCLPILLNHSFGPHLLEDTDTRVLLEALEERRAPFSWFTTDWPLENHFYRPVSTLAFNMDLALYGWNNSGFGRSNAIFTIICILLLYWLLRELTESVAVSTAAALLFSAWHQNALGGTAEWLGYLAWVPLVVCIFRRGSLLVALLALFAVHFAAGELQGVGHFAMETVHWIPGRTATVMTIFVLAAMAAYARFERTGAARLPAPNPTPLDPPATKGTVAAAVPSHRAWLWLLLSTVSLALALGSYEQAVMLPGALIGVAVSMRLRRYQIRWWVHATFWALLAAYLLLRSQILGWDASGYQQQQFRSGPGVWLGLFDYIFPALGFLYTNRPDFSFGWTILLTPVPYMPLIVLARNVAAVVASARHWVLALTGWALSIIAYLPMAWMKPFGHYHYWPMAMRSLFVVVLLWGCWELAATAMSPRAIRAPRRLDPAPGSLPRP